MKKLTAILLLLTCCFSLAACGNQAPPLSLPKAEDVQSVDVTAGDQTVSHENRQWIEQALSVLAEGKPTRQQSVQDTPVVGEYLKIDFHFQQGTSTLFIYEKGGKFYLEQPYRGIYEYDRPLYQLLTDVQ